MAASLHPFSLPSISSYDESGCDDADTSIRGWDHSIVSDLPDDNANDDHQPTAATKSSTKAKTVTFHALAHGHTVIGTSSSHISHSDRNGVLWQTSLDERVVTVASNNDGSIIAAATSKNVSLLKGRDGSILATRQITNSSNAGSSSEAGFSPQLVFITSNVQSNASSSGADDVLAVVCPVNTRARTSNNNNNQSNVILISNIDGKLLNSSNSANVREGATKMSMEALPLNSNGNDCGVVTWMEGAFVNSNVIRFFLKHWDFHKGGRPLSVYDYNVTEKRSDLVLKNLGDHLANNNGNSSSEVTGMGIDANCPVMGTFLLAAFSSNNATGTATTNSSTSTNANSIAWINILDLSISAKYSLPSDTSILSCTPIQSHDGEICLSAALAYQTSSNTQIKVVQSIVAPKEEKGMKESDSMVLFNIAVEQNSSIEVCAPSADAKRGAYTFRYLSKPNSGDASGKCWEFNANDQERMGVLHHLLSQHSFERAYDLTEKMARYSICDQISTPTDKSLLSLAQFRHVLSKDVSREENRMQAQECVRRLTSVAISSGGGEHELESMVKACEFLMDWPRNQAGCAGSKGTMVSIQEVSMALSAMTMAIKSAVDVLGSSKAAKLEEQKRKLDDRCIALKALNSIVPSLERTQITLDDPFLAVESVIELMHVLVAQGAFKSVECLQTSDYGKKMLPHPDVVSSTALKIPLTVDPRSFLPWLCDVIIPSLSIGHPLLGQIRSWTCKAADHYDEGNILCGIDSSIQLLTAVSEATARLTVAMNNCFSYPMQLELDSNGSNEQLITPRNNEVSSFFTSFDSKASTRSIRSSRPTVLSIGMISGMKRKDGRMMSAQRVSPNTNTSLDLSFFSSPFSSPNSMTEASIVEEDDDSEEHDCVEYKLNEAIRLKTARGLGMPRHSLTLPNYSSKGEQYIMKELVKSALNESSVETVEEIRSYAADVDADFDDAVKQYANELCDSNRDNIPHVLEQSRTLSQWCGSPSVKCLIVLRMLRLALVSVQRPPDLTPLAKEAISKAADDSIKSELQEATRLLGIDSLVRKYCGNGAQEFFRVSDPSHGLTLVQHVCRHIDVPTVMADALMLCDAFTHVSKLDTCVSLLQRVMAAPSTIYGESDRAGQCASFVKELYSKDKVLAETVGERMVDGCRFLLEDCKKLILHETFSEEAERQAMIASSIACSMLSVMGGQTVISGKRIGSKSGLVAPKLLREFQQISKLQSGCGIFLTIEELRDPSSCAKVVSDLLQPCVGLLLSRKSLLEIEDDDTLRNELKPLVATARQWCAIMCDSSSRVTQIWSRAVGMVASQVAKTSTNHASVLLLEVSGLLDERDGHSSFHSVMSVVLALYARTSSEAHHLSRSMSLITQDETDLLASLIAMGSMAQASLLLREHILLYCPSLMLSSSLSLGNLTELVSEISSRTDNGLGERVESYIASLEISSRHRQQSYTPAKKSARMLADKRIPSPPILHPTWYIGDGLLLQPLEALSLSMSYTKMILDMESSTASSKKVHIESDDQLMGKSEMINVLESKGAHATSLRVLLLSTATSMSQSTPPCDPSKCHLVFPNAENILKKNCCVLAERSLGGTESGLTSGIIDALMSLSFLLHLPKEMAFKIYQAALPSAIGKRDYSRILTLTSIGTYCGVGTFSSGERFPWSKQRRFIDQCVELSSNATWWKILSQYSIGFDPSVFSQSRDSKSLGEQTLQSYCEKLVWSASKKLDPPSILMLARRFMKDYGLNKYVPPSSLIEFLLSAPNDESLEQNSEHSQKTCRDIRHDLNQTEAAVRDCLALLPIINRNVVLRKCVMSIEKDHRCSKDYGRHAMVLQLYRECLDKLSGVMKKSGARAKAHEEETMRIERRQDALVVVSSIFDKYQWEKRPDYPKLFQPLPGNLSHSCQDAKFSVLGIGDAAVMGVFDPLLTLDGVLTDENGSNSIVAALAPLCSLLQLPSGYLHARSLVVRFRKLKASGAPLPSFDTTVVPVAKKLKTQSDTADLAWWAANQYDAGSVEQLKCLDMAHANATEASEEAEASRGLEEESVALERVKRIDAARAGLSDKILVDEVLKRHGSTTNLVKVLYKSVIDKVHKRAQLDENYHPEHLVQALLVEGSHTAAVASLDDADSFSTHHFRLLALLVHDACKSLSIRYSHVNVGKCARALTRRWLVHGDDLEDGFASNHLLDAKVADEAEIENVNEEQQSMSKVKPAADDCEDTSEFVMDIGLISAGSNQNWSNDSKREENDGGITSSEEPSALKSLSSLRESSNHLCSRVALRIAFLICFAEDYHVCNDTSSPEKDNENVDSNLLAKRQKMRSRSKVAPQKLSLQKSNCFEGDLALQHARELLSIVFARQGSAVASTYDFLFDESLAAYDDSVPENAVREDFHSNSSKALSFAMRHRALRVATIICPQEVIARVVIEETYSSSNDVGDDHLNKCAFASFVAMEIEAMGLPLPHSDLVQLSIMHFPSYARTIWRNHGGSSSRGFSGRLLLLLLELCVNHQHTIDWELFMLIFSELNRLELPRSLLLACECAVQSRAIALAASQERYDVLQNIENATKTIAKIIVSEVETNLGAGLEFNTSECSSTMHRLVSVINMENGHTDPTCFVQSFCDISSRCKEQGQKAISDIFIKAAIRITTHLTDPEAFCKSLSIITSIIDGRDTMYENISHEQTAQLRHLLNSVCNEAIQNFESSFH